MAEQTSPKAIVGPAARRFLRFLGTAVASGVLVGFAGSAHAGPDGCAGVGTATITCSGDQSDGVGNSVSHGDFSSPPTTTVNINNLTTDISTAANAVYFLTNTTDPTVLNIDTGEFSIENVSGAAIIVTANDGAGILDINATVTSASGAALTVAASTTLDIALRGDFTGASNAIAANSSDTTIDSWANVTATVGAGFNINGTSPTLNIHSGTVYGAHAGVQAAFATSLTVNNSGTLSSGTTTINALLFSTVTVNNGGLVTGNIESEFGSSVTFNNLSGGTFRSGATLNLAGQTLTNAGTLSPGGTGSAQTSAITGDLVQTSTGNFAVDVNESGSSDLLTVSGTATFAGFVTPNVLNISSETGDIVIMTASALTSTASAVDTAGYDFSLYVSGGNELHLTWEQVSSIVALLTNANANQRAIAVYLDTLNAAGPSAALQALFDALAALGEPELITALNQLLPELYSDAQISTLYASQGFANNLLSCKVNGPGTASIIQEGQCLWAGASATFLDQSTTFSQLGFKETTGSFAAGAQVALDDNWRLGFGAGYQTTSVDTVTNASSDGNTGQVGLALKYNVGSILVAGTVSGGRAWYDTKRPVAFTGFNGVATSDSHIDVLNGGFRFAYVFGTPHLYFKPVLDAAITSLDLGGFTETGGGAANLTVAGSRQTVYTLAPWLEAGTEWWLADGTLIRPFLRGGVTFYEGNEFGLSAAFAGAPAGVSPFTINTKMDDTMGVIGVGLDMVTAQELVVRFAYDGQFGETTQIHSVAVKGSMAF